MEVEATETVFFCNSGNMKLIGWQKYKKLKTERATGTKVKNVNMESKQHQNIVNNICTSMFSRHLA